MKLGLAALLAADLALCACRQGAQQDDAPRANEVAVAPAAPLPRNESQDTAPLAEPRGAIDPKSIEAAGQVVQHYGALVEQKRWAEANELWGDAPEATKMEGELRQYAEVHLEIGNLGEPEGAAGSIYVTMPVIFYGDTSEGQPFRRKADIILRRVNDVPGSTEEQRRWHIERIDLAAG